MKRILSFLLVFVCTFASAQVYIDFNQMQQYQNVRLKLQLQDAASHEAIPYASVYLVPKGDTTVTNFALTDESIEYYGVLIFASPDILSGLVSWAYFDNASQDAVAVPWGSGCSTTIRAVIKENDLQGRQCFIGLFDPSVRTKVHNNELMFAIPKSRLEEMTEYVHETCLFNGKAWQNVRERINLE